MPHTSSSSPIDAAQAFARITFDYIIIGGGPGGLPVANRLSEDPNVLVGVLEAGPLHNNDPLIDVPRFMGLSNGDPKYDWADKTTPQVHADGRAIEINRGKMLGGSTSINFMVWDRASKPEYDAWRKLGAPEGAWDWDALLPYFKRSEEAAQGEESFDPFPSWSLSEKDVINAGVPIGEALGISGVVKTSFNETYMDVTPPFVKACNAIGIPTNAYPYGGNATGVYNTRRAIDSKCGKRVDAVRAYYTSVSSRQNLKVLTGAHVTKVLFKPERDAQGNLLANSVEFVHDGKTFTANVTKEVILSAGAIQTPQILELSGIGDEKRLGALGIRTLVDLPGVGENLQDHLFSPIQYAAKSGFKTWDELRNKPEFAAEQKAIYDDKKKGWMAAVDSTVAFVPLAKVVDSTKFASLITTIETSMAERMEQLSALQKKQYGIQLDWLRNAEVAQTEIIIFQVGRVNPQEGTSYFVMMSAFQHPFSRGSVHITSTDSLTPPMIDPRYLSNPFDLEALSVGYRLTEKIASTKPFEDVIEHQSFPPVRLEKDEDVSAFIAKTFASGKHLMGTAALARRDLGGVVANDLKVYGTSNLRVSDASLIPVPMACHIQATIYAIGEKAADLIKGDWELM